MPPLQATLSAPVGQALPYIYHAAMGSTAGALSAASRCTWAFARDDAMPLAHIWRRVGPRYGTPVPALALTTAVQMLLGLVDLRSSPAFLAFVSIGVISLAVSYAIPIIISMCHRRREVNRAPWSMGTALGWPVNAIAIAWITSRWCSSPCPPFYPSPRGT